MAAPADEPVRPLRAAERPALGAGKAGGAYIPPFKLAAMMKEAQDKESPEYQRLTWDALRKSINGLVNKVNASNIKHILPEFFSEVRQLELYSVTHLPFRTAHGNEMHRA